MVSLTSSAEEGEVSVMAVSANRPVAMTVIHACLQRFPDRGGEILILSELSL